MTTVYFVRHAAPNIKNHDDLTRELTAQGREDRKLVTEFLWDKDIDVIFSSPYKRAVDTIKEFADKRKLEIRQNMDFRERKVGKGWIEDFDGFCKRQWEDFDYKLPDGESLQEVQERNIHALHEIVEENVGKNIVVGSHGTALSTIIHYFDSSFGYPEFYKIKNVMPWIVCFSFDGSRCLEIQAYDVTPLRLLEAGSPSVTTYYCKG